MVVKFREVGNSISVTIPKDIVKAFNIASGKEANVDIFNDSIMVTPIVKKRNITIKSLFANYKGSYKPEEIDWGGIKGKEVW